MATFRVHITQRIDLDLDVEIEAATATEAEATVESGIAAGVYDSALLEKLDGSDFTFEPETRVEWVDEVTAPP